MLIRTSARRAMTLLELLVVLGILALLAAVTIPKLVDMYDRSRSATQAYSLTDTSRLIETFYGLNHRYPDGWDTLLLDGGTPYTRLSANLRSPRTFLATAELTDSQISALNAAGISHVFLHDDGVADRSSSGVDRRHYGDGNGHDGTANIRSAVVIDKSAGSDGLNLLVNSFGLNPNRPATDTVLPRISANTYVVFGLGPKCTAVQGTIQNAPFLEHATSATTYSRALVVFEVPNTGGLKAKLVGVLGPDGRAISQSISDFNNLSGPQPH